MPAKTNAARYLDQLGIHYELREYEVDADDLAAETVAAKIGLPAEQVFKTLVARGERNGEIRRLERQINQAIVEDSKKE